VTGLLFSSVTRHAAATLFSTTYKCKMASSSFPTGSTIYAAILFNIQSHPSVPGRYIYDMIETLLPEAVYDKTKGRGRLLHMWSDLGVEREGWTHIVEAKGQTKK